jgi:hypothetical protein
VTITAYDSRTEAARIAALLGYRSESLRDTELSAEALRHAEAFVVPRAIAPQVMSQLELQRSSSAESYGRP